MREKKNGDGKITVEKRERIEVEDVPLYRSYGVTKKVNLRRRRVMEALGKAWTVFFLGVELGLILFITFLFAFYTDVLVATTLFIVLFLIFFFRAFSTLDYGLVAAGTVCKTAVDSAYRSSAHSCLFSHYCVIFSVFKHFRCF